jgi:hypothetical protein
MILLAKRLPSPKPEVGVEGFSCRSLFAALAGLTLRYRIPSVFPVEASTNV